MTIKSDFLTSERSRWQAKVTSLISIYQTADEYRVSIRTLRRLQAAGKMPERVRLGRKLVYQRQDIARLFRATPETL